MHFPWKLDLRFKFRAFEDDNYSIQCILNAQTMVHPLIRVIEYCKHDFFLSRPDDNQHFAKITSAH